MSEINAQLVKELREKTGAGLMDCKKALSESGGDMAKAEEWLRKKGISKAASKGARVAAEGLVGLEVASGVAVIIEVNSETDFVARNEAFVKLTADLLRHVAEHQPADVEALLAQPHSGKTVRDVITEKVATIGENISVRRFARLVVPTGGVVGAYLHSNNRVGALVELSAPAASEPLQQLARSLAMQVVAMNPRYLDRTQVPAEVLAKEKDIYKEELIAAKKPEAMWEKILPGKLEKFYDQVCLVDQAWIQEDKKRIRDLLTEATKAAGGPVAVARFVRFEVGEGIEKKKDDLAAEVAKTLGQG